MRDEECSMNTMLRGLTIRVFALGSLAVAAGCATVPPPTEQMAVSRAALGDAVSAGAGEYAGVDLRDAQLKLDAANVAMGSREYDKARIFAEEAEVDAKLAATRARSAKAQRAVAELNESLRVLRDELSRSPR
jgi:uncharacterized protein DUF4398